MTCFFCTVTADSPQRVPLEFESFFALWDAHPVTPGHALVIPKRHVQFMKELNQQESTELIAAVCKVKGLIKTSDLAQVTQSIIKHRLNTTPIPPKVFEQLRKNNGQPPQAFNDGVNDGPIAGQTVPHFHWHILPRWQGDIEDPRGGIRHMLPSSHPSPR